MRARFCRSRSRPARRPSLAGSFSASIPAFVSQRSCSPRKHPASLPSLLLYALLGALIGLAAAAFIRGVELCRDRLRAHRQSLSAQRHRHARDRRPDLRVAAHRRPLLCRGRRLLDHPGDSFGPPCTPRAAVRAVRRQDFATSISLGSGASGGIFSPSLFMGATLGGAFGVAGQFISCRSRALASPPAPLSAWPPWSAAAPAPR